VAAAEPVPVIGVVIFTCKSNLSFSEQPIKDDGGGGAYREMIIVTAPDDRRQGGVG
jgi:hypothetical protein